MDRPFLTERIEKLVLTGIIFIIIFRPIMYWIMPASDVKVAAYSLLEKSWTHQIIEFLILATALFYILKLALIRDVAVRKTPVDWPILAFLIVSALSLVYSANRDLSARSLLLLFTHILFFYLVVQNLGRAEVVKFCGLLAGLATAISLYGLYEYFFLYRFIWEHMDIDFVDAVARNMISLRRVSSVFGWPNRLAGFLGMAIPVSIGLLLYEKRPKFRLLLCLCIIIMFGCMLFTFSIGGWMVLIGALILAGIFSFLLIGSRLRRFISRRRVLISVITVLLIVVLVGAGRVVTEKRATPITAGAIKCRIAYLKGALGIIRDNFILGTGLGTFRLIYPQYMPAEKGYGAWHAHNSYLEVWSETGLAGMVLFLIFIARLINAGFRSLFDTENQGHRFVIAGLITGIIAFLTHNLIEFTYYCPEVSLSWWLLAGLLLVYPVRKAGPDTLDELSNGVYPKEKAGFNYMTPRGRITRRTPRGVNYISKARNRRIVLVTAAILLLLALLTLKNNFVGDIYFYKAIRFVRTGEFQKAIREYEQALRFNLQDSRYHNGLGTAYWLMSMKEGTGGQFLYKAEKEYKQAIRLSPSSAEAHNNLANIYAQTNQDPQAIEEYKKAIKLNRAFVGAYYNLGVIYERQGRPDEAKQAFEKATQLRDGS